MSGKRPRVGGEGQQHQPIRTAPQSGEISSVTSICKHSSLTKAQGLIKNFSTSILVDSGSSFSLVSADIVRICSLPIEHTDAITMQTASCDTFKLSSFVLPIKIGRLDAIHKALVCKQLVSPVILGTDFMSLYGIIGNFESKVITASGYGVIWSNNDISPLANKTPCCPIHTNESLWENTFTVSAIVPDSDEAEDCAIPCSTNSQFTHDPIVVPNLKILLHNIRNSLVHCQAILTQ